MSFKQISKRPERPSVPQRLFESVSLIPQKKLRTPRTPLTEVEVMKSYASEVTLYGGIMGLDPSLGSLAF